MLVESILESSDSKFGCTNIPPVPFYRR